MQNPDLGLGNESTTEIEEEEIGNGFIYFLYNNKYSDN